eukprot:1181332-Prorocentrum_minimum.AAC.4
MAASSHKWGQVIVPTYTNVTTSALQKFASSYLIFWTKHVFLPLFRNNLCRPEDGLWEIVVMEVFPAAHKNATVN